MGDERPIGLETDKLERVITKVAERVDNGGRWIKAGNIVIGILLSLIAGLGGLVWNQLRSDLAEVRLWAEQAKERIVKNESKIEMLYMSDTKIEAFLKESVSRIDQNIEKINEKISKIRSP